MIVSSPLTAISGLWSISFSIQRIFDPEDVNGKFLFPRIQKDLPPGSARIVAFVFEFHLILSPFQELTEHLPRLSIQV
jgi:hypothetical protein